MEWYWIILIIAMLILVLAASIYGFVYIVRKAFSGKPIGSTCSAHTDCSGWGPGPTDIACCQGICAIKKVDWAGVGYCPNYCVGCPNCSPGTCGPPYGNGIWHWPREATEPCTLNTDCKNWGTGANNYNCCNGICTQNKIDWAGIGYCPDVCEGCAGCPGGSCGNWHTPRSQGEPCALDTDCEGWSVFGTTACCNNRCVKKDESVQTCPNFCNNHPNICNAPWPT